MKNIVLFFVSCLLAFTSSAQTNAKTDVISKINGDELKGKVLKIGEADVSFAYKGETLEYQIKKSDISKITFASGRVETFNTPSTTLENTQQAKPAATVVAGTADHHNRIAILPFTFISDKQSAGDEMSYKVQNESFIFLSKHAGEYSVIDPRTTNGLLIKANATPDKIRGFTMDELCNILGVEYIIDGTVTMDKGDQYSSSSGSYSSTGGYDSKSGKDKTKVSGGSSSSTTQSYQTSMTMTIYNDKNSTIFNQDHQSFWSTTDAYKITLQYLLKKSPLYTK